MAICEQLPDLEGGVGEHVYPWAILVISQYNECATIHNGLVESLNEKKAQAP